MLRNHERSSSSPFSSRKLSSFLKYTPRRPPQIPLASTHTGWEHVISSILCLFNGCSSIVFLAVHGSRMLSQTTDFQSTEAQEHLVQSDWFVKSLVNGCCCCTALEGEDGREWGQGVKCTGRRGSNVMCRPGRGHEMLAAHCRQAQATHSMRHCPPPHPKGQGRASQTPSSLPGMCAWGCPSF